MSCIYNGHHVSPKINPIPLEDTNILDRHTSRQSAWLSTTVFSISRTKSVSLKKYPQRPSLHVAPQPKYQGTPHYNKNSWDFNVDQLNWLKRKTPVMGKCWYENQLLYQWDSQIFNLFFFLMKSFCNHLEIEELE